MVDIVHVNQFESRLDNRVKLFPVTWSVFVDFILSEPVVSLDKHSVPLFNCVQYKDTDTFNITDSNLIQDKYTLELYTRRRSVNITNVDSLILDYDGGLKLEDAKEVFRDYEYLGYTSFNHRFTHDTEKFRIIIKLTKPIPSIIQEDDYGYTASTGIWDELKQSILEFAGDCDPASTNQNQIYHIPSVHPNNQDNYSSWHNKGKSLDWEIFKRFPVLDKKVHINPDGRSVTKIQRSNKHLHPNDVLDTEIGPIRVGDIKSKIEGVSCPFHDDKKGSEFVKYVPKTGNTFLYCRKCNESFFMEQINKQRTDDEIDDIPLLAFDHNKVFIDGSDRASATKRLQEIERQIIKDKHSKVSHKNSEYKSHVIYSPEGSGKSHLVVSLARKGEKIIFACKSWKQAEQKYNEFSHLGNQLGFTTEIVRSKDAKAQRRFGVKMVKEKQKSPYLPARPIDEKTIESFIQANPDLNPDFIRLSWRFFATDKLSFESFPYAEFDNDGNEIEVNHKYLEKNVNIIITSFEQLRIHKLQNITIPKDWIIWFDDPDINDVVDIEPYNKSESADMSDSDLQRLTTKINNTTYFSRDTRKSLGYSLRKHQCVYTTTELIAKQAIEKLLNKRTEKYVVHDNMENIVGGKITILGTNKVWKRHDGIIPLLSRRLNKLGYPVTLIADGLSATFNHSNNKGRNDLNKTDILVELSCPHPNQIRTICDALNMDFKLEGNAIRNSIMLDRLHQAIGRNSGYRYQGFQSIVLVDKSVHKSLIKETRYFIDYENSVIIDRTITMSRKDSRITKTATPLVLEVENLLNNIDSYISDKRKIKHDLEYVVKTIENDSDRIKLIIRILMSFINYSGVRFDENPLPNSETHTQEKYREMGEWLLNTWVQEDKRDYVIKESHKD